MCRLVNVKTNFNTGIEVADIKKEVVENIIEAAGVCSRICQIILFGSVIESRCTEDYDVDMLVISDTPRSKLYKDKGYQEFLRRLHEKATKGIAAYHAQQAVEKIIKSEIYKANPDIPSPTFESPPSECLNISSYCAATPETPRSTA